MKPFKYMFLALVLGGAAFAAAQDNYKDNYKADDHDHLSPFKPGADVQLNAVQVGSANVGETAQLDINVLENQISGTMKLDVVSLSGLSLVGSPGSLNIDTADGDSHTMSLSLSGTAPGRFYVNVRLTQDNPFGPQSTVFALPVQIGTQPGSKLSPAQNSGQKQDSAAAVPASQNTSSENGRIVFQAIEEIR